MKIMGLTMNPKIFEKAKQWISNERERTNYYTKTVFMCEDLLPRMGNKSLYARQAQASFLEALESLYRVPKKIFCYYSEFVRMSLIWYQVKRIGVPRDEVREFTVDESKVHVLEDPNGRLERCGK